MKIVKKYVFFVPLLLATLTNIVNAAVEYAFKLENNNSHKIQLYVLIRDKAGNDIFEKHLFPGESFDKKIGIADPANSYYAVVALAADKESFWGIATPSHGMVNMTTANGGVSVDPKVNFEGEGKDKFQGLVKANFELGYTAEDTSTSPHTPAKGTFSVKLIDA